ncbi:hypothetical protein CN090_04520 [Sinorhizobium meliloti]|uniref:hypothetical protein n=1 Tax=Rhizobium meliloti TaxID=382 RepID=UPI000FDB96D7|nr:hypothetical protein [Sinorhizobium meliloti]RVO55185.1 hypothetical protein CN090_04520 [Sinorhizobium meliloti]
MANNAWKNEKRRIREAERVAREEAEQSEYWDRYNDLWKVPERAKHEYLMMEDNFCPETVLDFMKAMYPDEQEAE